MDINRNNYEEYFLLYADDELTDSEKAQVLMFLKENKDLEAEFRMIHQTILKPDTSIGLTDKSFLLKGEEEPVINEKNYEEIFVLYHDNELTGSQKIQTKEFLSRREHLRNEFELIGLARLTPEDAVVFPNKKILYRKEKAGKVVPIIFWRVLAAAIFIGFGLWITYFYVQKGHEKPGIAAKIIPSKQVPVVPNNAEINPKKEPVNTLVLSEKNSKPSEAPVIPHKDKLQKPLSQKAAINSLVKVSVKTQKPVQESITIQPAEKINDEIVSTNEETGSIPREQIEEDNKSKQSNHLARDAIQSNVTIEPVKYAQNVSYVSDANDNNQNYVFYDITNEEFKKTKVGGFLKKVKRVIERNNPISRLLSGGEKQVASNR
jgi:cytoskeletal protein RodZ